MGRLEAGGGGGDPEQEFEILGVGSHLVEVTVSRPAVWLIILLVTLVHGLVSVRLELPAGGLAVPGPGLQHQLGGGGEVRVAAVGQPAQVGREVLHRNFQTLNFCLVGKFAQMCCEKYCQPFNKKEPYLLSELFFESKKSF